MGTFEKQPHTLGHETNTHNNLQTAEGLAAFLTLDVDETYKIVKVGDWGFAAICKPGEKIETACGSLDYAAPEILSGKAFGSEVDVWSLGTMTPPS